MFGKGGLGNLMKQAQQMQEKMQKMQEEIGAAGSHRRIWRRSGKSDHQRCTQLPSRRDRPEPAGRRQRDAGRLVAAAFNDAARRIEETQKEKMASVSSGMQLPPGFKMPF